MATINYKVCDRCHERINYHSGLLAKVQTYRPIKIAWIVCGVVSNAERELCGKCADELEEFLEPKAIVSPE